MRIRRALLTLALVVAAGCTSSPGPLSSTPVRRAAPVIRVLLADFSSRPRARLSGSGAYTVTQAGTDRVLETGRDLDRRTGLAGATLDHEVRIHTDGGPLRVEDVPYPGDLLLVPTEDGVAVVNETDLECYLPGVLAGELGAAFPAAALRAQAVASRSYALERLMRNPLARWHVTDDTGSQVYRGRPEAGDGPLTRAVHDTSGIILSWAGRPLRAYFHSACGGHTASATDVFHEVAPPPLSGTPCGFCGSSPRASWTVGFPRSEAAAALGISPPIQQVSITGKTRDGRARTLRFTGASTTDLTAVEVRARLGPGSLPSTRLGAVTIEAGELVFAGSGFGHGVGMCQWGAIGMARKGAAPADILAQYYPAATLTRIY